jgi:hypothetical protein
MKKAYALLLFCTVFFACKKDSPEPTNNDEYYVKYEVESSSIYYGGTLNVVLSADYYQNTTFTIPTRSPWETVIGPVNRGFQANLSVSEIEPNYDHLKIQTQISVSKNGSPFAIKQIDDSDMSRTFVQTSYVIDY